MEDSELFAAIKSAAKASGITDVNWTEIETYAQGDQDAVFEAVTALDDDTITVTPELKDAINSWPGWTGDYWYEADGMKARLERNWTTASPN